MALTYNVPGMTCEHCVRIITETVQEAVPGSTVDIDLASHRVEVGGTDDDAAVRRAIVSAGYDTQ